MHWLRDLMREGPTPVGSLGELARRALVHPAWPADARPQPRSLAALLSKLDRGLELEWLEDRPEVQQVLADVLGTPRARIEGVVGGGLRRTDQDQGRLRFTDVPFASPLDLGVEPLPPGIPGKVLRPAEWDGVWWVAPSGSGRSLAGRWLAARSLATFVSAPDWERARASIPDSGPVFIELVGPTAAAAIAVPLGAAATAAPRAGLCVAAAYRPIPEFEKPWNLVESAPPAAWLEALVTWLARRLPRDGHFDPKSALEWLTRAADDGLIEGLGSALGLASLIDERGVEQLGRLGMTRVMEQFVRERLAKSGTTVGRETAWVEKNGAKILLGMGRRMLASETGTWDAPRPETAWMDLVPEEYRDSVDTEWLRLSLSRAARPSTVKDIETALRDLPPGTFRVVRAFSQAGLLGEEGGPHALVLRPAWLARFVHQKARRSVLEGGPQEWGESLLSRDAAWVVRGVVARVLDGDVAVLEDAVDSETPRDPAVIAALELAFLAAGIALLGGVDIPNDLRLALWDQQMEGIVERSSGPHPRVGYGNDANACDPFFDAGTFRLAALALSEGLPASRGRSHALLRPWTAHPGRARLAPLVDSVARAAARFDWKEHPWIAGGFELFDRLALVNGEADADSERSAMEWPALLLRHAVAGTLSFAEVRRAGMDVVPALLALGAQTNVEHRLVARSLWMAWLATPEPIDERSALSPWSKEAAILYSAAPPDALAVLFGRGLVEVRQVPYAVFDADQWYAILHSSPEALRGAPQAFEAMPRAVTRAALGRLTLGAEEVAVVWRREPDMALDALADAVVLDVARALALLAAAPPERSGRICEKLGELHVLLPEALRHDGLRDWLHDCVARRADGFRTALMLLHHAAGWPTSPSPDDSR
jgi:hypothetical protein